MAHFLCIDKRNALSLTDGASPNLLSSPTPKGSGGVIKILQSYGKKHKQQSQKVEIRLFFEFIQTKMIRKLLKRV